ncbi:Low affinity ammonium transporter [Exophiala dermatitidis]
MTAQQEPSSVQGPGPGASSVSSSDATDNDNVHEKSLESPESADSLNLAEKPTETADTSKESSAVPIRTITRTRSTDLARHETATASSIHPTQSLTQSISRVPTATKPPEFSLVHEVLFVTVISAAQLLTQAALAMSIAPLHIIGNTFHTTNPGQLSWLPAAYSLTVGTFILPAGRWGDLYGHRKLFVFGYLWFAVWSAVAGFAAFSHSLVFFAFCRAMQGIGPALLLPNGIAVLSRTYPPGPRKNMVLSVFGATAPGGYLVGAVFSGIFAEHAWWPWTYWLLAIVSAIMGVLVILVVPRMPVAGPTESRWKELDVVGTVLGVVGLILFNFAWNQGPAAGWEKVYVYVLLIVGVLFLVVFFWYEKAKAAFPLIPMSSFSTDTRLVFGCIAAGWASFGIWVFYLWQFLELLRGQTVLLTAAQIVPTAISGAIAAIVTGRLIAIMQPGWIMLASMLAFLVGTILLATMPVKQTYWAQAFVSLIVTCWGMDMSFPSGVIVLSNHMPPEHQGLAASLINTVVNYSISIGLGMAGTVEVHVNSGGANELKGYRGAWYLGIGLDGLGVLLAIWLILSWRATIKAKEKAGWEDAQTQA